jgi:hypothetical protein
MVAAEAERGATAAAAVRRPEFLRTSLRDQRDLEVGRRDMPFLPVFLSFYESV